MNAVAVDPDDWEAYTERAFLYEAKGEYDLAIVDFSTAIGDNQGLAEYHDNRGRAYEAKGNRALAKADFDAAERASEEVPVEEEPAGQGDQLC